MYVMLILGYDDNDDAMSGTNTDVTLPPMSAFSSRLGKRVKRNFHLKIISNMLRVLCGIALAFRKPKQGNCNGYDWC